MASLRSFLKSATCVTAVCVMTSGGSLVSASDDTGSKLTARQLYYYKGPKTGVKKGSQAVTNPPKARPQETPEPKPADTEPPKPVAAPDPPAEAPYLGLRWSLFDEKTLQEIDPTKIFHSGEKFRLKLQANSSGYLYVINEGSRHDVVALFPSAEVTQSNRIEPGQTALVPMQTNFVFDPDPGQEKLFVVLSRQREPDLDALIQSVTSQQKTTGDSGKLLARNSIKESDLDHIRGKLASRGIRLETVQVSKGEKENAAYVADVNYNSPRLVTEIVLKHE